MDGKVRLKKIVYGERPAGYTTEQPPPQDYIGRIGVIERELINNYPTCYWVRFIDNKCFVIAEEELEEVKG